MMKILLIVQKRDIVLIEKKNLIVKDLFSKKYKPRIVKPKKEKEVIKEKIKLKSSTNLLNNF